MNVVDIKFYDENETLVNTFDFGAISAGQETYEQTFYLYYKKGYPENEDDYIENVVIKIVNKDGIETGVFVDNGIVRIKVLNEDGASVINDENFMILRKGKYFVIPKLYAGKKYIVKMKLLLPVSFASSGETEAFKLILLPSSSYVQLSTLEAMTKANGVYYDMAGATSLTFKLFWGGEIFFGDSIIEDFRKYSSIDDVTKTWKVHGFVLDKEGEYLRIVKNDGTIGKMYKDIKFSLSLGGEIIVEIFSALGDLDYLKLTITDEYGEQATATFQDTETNGLTIYSFGRKDFDNQDIDWDSLIRIEIKSDSSSAFLNFILQRITIAQRKFLKIREGYLYDNGVIKTVPYTSFDFDDMLYSIDVEEDEKEFSFLIYLSNDGSNYDWDYYSLEDGISSNPNYLLGRILVTAYTDENGYLVTKIKSFDTFPYGGVFAIWKEEGNFKVGPFAIKYGDRIFYNPTIKNFGELIEGGYILWLSDTGGIYLADNEDEEAEGYIKLAEFNISKNGEIFNFKKYIGPSIDTRKDTEKVILGLGVIGYAKLYENDFFRIGLSSLNNKKIFYRRY